MRAMQWSLTRRRSCRSTINFQRENNATLTTILCTHGHYDHVGSAGVLSREWKARIYCEPATAGAASSFP